jgi:hypothetical protein
VANVANVAKIERSIDCISSQLTLINKSRSKIKIEPTFAAEGSTSTVTPKLAAQIQAAVAALPAAHRIPPQEKEIIENPEAAFVQLQDWAFTYSFALVKESGRADRVLFECTYHKKVTKNWRKTAELDRERVETKTQSRGCKFGLYMSKQKRLGGR